MFKFISKLFPSKHVKDVKGLLPIVEEINSYYEEYQKLTDDELRQKTAEFKELIKQNTQELEEKIAEYQEKLKGDLTHQERVDIYTELEQLDKLLHQTWPMPAKMAAG
jgi:preprotein translocase subunit SecA